MIEETYLFINLLGAYSLVVSIALITKDRNKIRGAYTAMAFLTCLLIYMIIGFVDNHIVYTALLIGPFLIPLTFWLMAGSFFNDHPLSNRNLIALTASTVLIYYAFYMVTVYSTWDKFASIGIRILSLVFIILAFTEAQSGKQSDLDENRLRLRKYFTFFIGIIALMTILSELGLSQKEQELPRLIQRSAILIINTIFIISNFSLKSRLFDTKRKETIIKHPELIEKIQSAMTDNRLFQKEQLTISQLAEAIGEQEYKVRRAINQELGYRNFIDFTNSFRIKAAVGILKDPSQSKLTILEIAYQTGFNSIGPFNRSFKQTTGLTPTEFRKKYMKG